MRTETQDALYSAPPDIRDVEAFLIYADGSLSADLTDRASALEEFYRQQSVQVLLAKQAQKLKDAEQRDEHDRNLCERCKKTIPQERLDAVRGTTRCFDCQLLVDKQNRSNQSKGR